MRPVRCLFGSRWLDIPTNLRHKANSSKAPPANSEARPRLQTFKSKAPPANPEARLRLQTPKQGSACKLSRLRLRTPNKAPPANSKQGSACDFVAMLAAFLRARLHYTNCRRAAALPHEAFVELSTQTKSLLASKLETYNLSLVEGTDIVTMISETEGLTEEDREQCFELVSVKTMGTPSTGPEPAPAQSAQGTPREATSVGQTFSFLENYLLRTQWEVLRNPALEVANKVYCVAEMFASLDLRHATEKSYACAIAVVIGAQPNLNTECLLAAAGPDGLKLVQMLKGHVSRLLQTEPIRPHDSYLKTYPRMPSDLASVRPALYEAVYSRERPAENPLDPITLARLKATVPCRGSKKSTQEPSKEDAREALLARLAQFLQKPSGPDSRSPALLDRIFGTDSQGSDSSASTLALGAEAGNQTSLLGQTAQAATPLQLALPAPATAPAPPAPATAPAPPAPATAPAPPAPATAPAPLPAPTTEANAAGKRSAEELAGEGTEAGQPAQKQPKPSPAQLAARMRAAIAKGKPHGEEEGEQGEEAKEEPEKVPSGQAKAAPPLKLEGGEGGGGGESEAPSRNPNTEKPETRPTPPDAGEILYRGIRIILDDKKMWWRIRAPAEVIPGGKDWTRQFGTKNQPPTAEKIEKAFVAALDCVDAEWDKRGAAAI